jgi:predicted kinase
METSHPKIIIVTGKPAAGKSTLANWLSKELQIPLVSKDSIRELLFDRLGWNDRPWAQLLGRASIDMMFYFANTELATGHSIILDNSFNPEMSNSRFQDLLNKHHADSIQIVCASDRETLFKRFKTRAEIGNRRPGHGDSEVLNELYENLANDDPLVLDIGSEIIEVDTTDFEKIDYQKILKRVKAFLDRKIRNYS